ncbi:MAG: hypothetical protein AB7H79_07920 [Sphingomonas sp.]
MNKVIIGAAGLLLSSTALAAVIESKAAAPLDNSMIHNAMLIDWTGKSMAAQAASDSKDFAEVANKQVAEPSAPEIPSTTAMTDADPAIEPVGTWGAQDGMGGPDEPDAVTTAAAAPATSYPACAPGPGDDNCIQLYEPGVSQAYAAWQAGYLPGSEQVGMGGPDEPVDGTGAVPAATADDYPPCQSRSDDRCIQLHEPGVRESLAAHEASRLNGEQLAMGGPEEDVFVVPASSQSDELAAYDEPLPEDLVLPEDEELAYTDAPTRSDDGTMAI